MEIAAAKCDFAQNLRELSDRGIRGRSLQRFLIL
jgi:hypothetical protein